MLSFCSFLDYSIAHKIILNESLSTDLQPSDILSIITINRPTTPNARLLSLGHVPASRLTRVDRQYTYIRTVLICVLAMCVSLTFSSLPLLHIHPPTLRRVHWKAILSRNRKYIVACIYWRACRVRPCVVQDITDMKYSIENFHEKLHTNHPTLTVGLWSRFR